ncbi:4-diphosphocytidyl-2-C-methyl-D-erythritol kinase [Peptostreptococcaceae bacterium pGA-8]|nr:4-diphosphocytidyl-2-C-methyl-D-erythritol kinase [Peptostreptococcaceae bacterium pGA-8]
MSKQISIKSFGKINLSIDVMPPGEDGYHPVDMIMARMDLYDQVKIAYEDLGNKKLSSEEQPCKIAIKCNFQFVPTDERNICFKAARVMADRFNKKGAIGINLQKTLPVGAGLAGGSGNGAAVLHGLNVLWNLKLTLSELCSIGAELGSDVPFSVVSQARGDRNLSSYFADEPMATNWARARGRGTELTPIQGMDKLLVLVKPKFGVSTAEVYKGIDNCEILERPDNDALVEALREKNPASVYCNMVNVLENYTLKKYPSLCHMKDAMAGFDGVEKVLMSGSGPTIYGIFDEKDKMKAMNCCQALRKQGFTAFFTRIRR